MRHAGSDISPRGVQKLQSEVGQLRRKLAGTENTAAKQLNSHKEQISSLKSKLALTERDLIDSHIQCAPAAAHPGFCCHRCCC